MTNNDELNSQLSQLEKFENSEDYSTIINTLNNSFDSTINTIIQKWISNETLSNNEKKYIDSYSTIQLSFVKYCFFNLNTQADVQTLVEKFQSCLFKRIQIDTLASAVEFIRDQQFDNNANENDLILISIIRMIDARSLAYRLCFTDLSVPPDKLNIELKACLFHRQTKNYLYDIKSIKTISIDHDHQFFIGCSTFAIALYEKNKDLLKDNDHYQKYICLLAKYIRVVLNKTNFEQNQLILYCIRGILALLTNCVPIEYWLRIMNDAFKDENNEDAQIKNPFNLDLFSSIVNKLLASKILQEKTEQSASNEETLVVDTALVFLVKWSDTQRNIHDDEENTTNLSISDQPNQLLRYFSSHEQFKGITTIIIPYIHAKYDRLRLMALSLLSTIMNNEDFEKLKKQNVHLGEDLVKLIFDFINQAEKQVDHRYKGISFDMLLHYLLRFLIQDFIKEQTIPYISQIVKYAQTDYLYALKILRKISTNPKLKENLLTNIDLKQFLDKDANIKYGSNEKMYKVVINIRENLAPPTPPKRTESLPSDNDNTRQAFISYCHQDKQMCKSIEDKLQEAGFFTKIWLDQTFIRDNLHETVATAIRESKLVFVLLSDAYCASPFCRREWNFALEENLKIYVIFVQEDFDRKKYDWVRFMISGDVYYKVRNHVDYQHLIKNISEFLNEKSDNKSNKKENTNQARSLFLPPKTSTIDREYLKKSLHKWTVKDVQNWCINNHLDKWCEPLDNYDGQNLIVFRQDLSNYEYVLHVLKDTSLSGIDVSRFKSEVDKFLSKTTTKPIRNRRTSNK